MHVFDRWFASGEVKMQDDVEMLNARIFAEFNRRSLVGMKAEQLSLRDMDGKRVSLFGAGPSGVAETGRGRLRILYFYDTGCANCLATTVLLRSLLQEKNYPADLYAVYSGADSLAWRAYAGERFGISAGNVRVCHLWDPDLESDFQRKYGVLQTPMLFLVGCDGKILGRHLDAPALGILLDDAVADLEYEYGGDESEAMLDAVFGTVGTGGAAADTGAGEGAGGTGDAWSTGGAGTAEAEVKAVIDTIAARAERDSVLYAHVMGDLLYYLSVRGEGCFKEAAKYLIDKYIYPKSQLWSALGDSLEVTGYAAAMDELLSRALPGTVIPKILVRGRMLDCSTVRRLTRHLTDAASDEASWETSGMVEKISVRRWNLRRLPGRETCVIFYSGGCARCRETLAAAADAARRGRRILLVDVDDNPPSAGPAASASASGSVSEGSVSAAADSASAASADPTSAAADSASVSASASESGRRRLLPDIFDLTSLPYIVRLSGRGTVLDRYLGAEDL